MNNNKIALYKGGRSSGLVKSNNSNNRTDIVQSNPDSQVNIISTLTPKQLQECKRIYNHALVHCGDYARDIKETGLSAEDRAKIAAASRAEKPTIYLKKDGVLQAKFPNQSNSSRTKSKSKKKSAKEEQQIATDNLILELKTQKQIVEDFLANERLGEPEREIIFDILDEEAPEYSTHDDIETILKNYLIYLKQKIESLDKTSTDADYRKSIYKAQAYKRDRIRTDEAIQAMLWSWNGKVPTLRKRSNSNYQQIAVNSQEFLVIEPGVLLTDDDTGNIYWSVLAEPIDIEENAPIASKILEHDSGVANEKNVKQM